MSRILPLEKDVNLDKRYINENETITESALKNVINGGGGGNASLMVVSSLEEYPTFDERIVGKDNICQKLGITSQDFDDIADGKILAIRIGHILLGTESGELRGLYPDSPGSINIGFGWLDPDSGVRDLNFGYNNGDYYLDGRNWE